MKPERTNNEFPTEPEKAQMLERAIKKLEVADQFYLCTLGKDGIKEYRNLKPNSNEGLTFLRVLSKVTEDIWNAIDKSTGRTTEDVKIL